MVPVLENLGHAHNPKFVPPPSPKKCALAKFVSFLILAPIVLVQWGKADILSSEGPHRTFRLWRPHRLG